MQLQRGIVVLLASVGERTNLKIQIQIGGIFVTIWGETCVWIQKYQLLMTVRAPVRCRIYGPAYQLEPVGTTGEIN